MENKMKIFIDGSKRSAVNRMFNVWKKLGHEIVRKPECADVQLSSVKIINKSKIPTILRLDGIYYNKGENYRSRNNLISISHTKADAIIYQSNLSRKMCEKYLSKRKTNIFKVIHNGIDPFDWRNPKEHDNINIVSCAKWRRPKRLQEIIQLFIKFLKYYSNAKLHIIGPMIKGSNIIKHPNIIYYGNVNYKKMRKIYSEMDIYLHLCKKDSCPSTVIESIASGIPVITTNVCGGATEVCNLTKGCDIIYEGIEALEPDYIYQDSYNKIPIKTENKIIKSMIEKTKNRIRVILPEELTIEYVAKQYLEIMEKVLNG
jgi:glycosyltransferase involved in cell wall biosynthesis